MSESPTPLERIAAAGRTVGAALRLVRPQRPSPLVAEIFDTVETPVLVLDASGRELAANPAARHLFGRDGAIGWAELNRLLQEPAALLAADRRAAAGELASLVVTLPDGNRGGRLRVQVRLLTAVPGARLWSFHPVAPATETGVPAVAAPPHPSPDRPAPETAEDGEAGRYRRLIEEAPVGIALIDAAGRIAEANQAFFRTIDGDAGVLGQPFHRLVVSEERTSSAVRLRQALDAPAANPSGETTLEVRLRGRRHIVAQLFLRRIDGILADGGTGLILFCLDVTERKNLETQVSQSQKMQAVGQLAGGVAHDFNNLLTAMIGFCDLLLLRHKPGDRSFADIMQIKQNANRAANLVRQLLAFSRQQTLQARVLDITDVLTEIYHLLRRLIGENIELSMLHGRDLGLVKVDQGQLEQVIINLAVNARDAMPNGGRLTIATRNLVLTEPLRLESEAVPIGEYVVTEVIDTGVGIPPEHLPRIFEPFFSTKEVGAGTGLGLSTVYGIVRQTGGYVMVESPPGEGAKFSVLLPRYHGEAEPAADPAQQSLESRDRAVSDLTGSECVLLVEDEDAVRMFSARALRNKGYQVVEAKTGVAALEQLDAPGLQVDLLITDVVMPEMDGPTLIRRVRERMPDLKVICISGYAEDRFRERIGVGPPVHYLGKPFSLKQLATKVREVLRGEGPRPPA